MDESVCVREFENLAMRLGIEIRYITEGPSGLCTIKGNHVMFVDKTLDDRAILDVFVRDFKGIDLGRFFVVPVIRELLDRENEDAD